MVRGYVSLIGMEKGGAAGLTVAMDDDTSSIAPKCKVLAGAMSRVLDAQRDALRAGVSDALVARLVR